jgi:DNA-binding transcriptional LysR family regulator
VRGLEFPPALVRAYAAENFFDLALLPGGFDRLPATWVSVNVGEIRKGLYGSPALARALGPQPVFEEKIRTIPFIGPIYNADGQFVPMDDDCPLARRDRLVGHEAQTIGLALELAARTDHLVYGPAFAARRYVDNGALVEVAVRGWNASEPLFVVCNADRVRAKVQTAIVEALREALLGLGGSNAIVLQPPIRQASIKG